MKKGFVFNILNLIFAAVTSAFWLIYFANGTLQSQIISLCVGGLFGAALIDFIFDELERSTPLSHKTSGGEE